MGIFTAVGRVSIGWLFVSAGVDVLRKPEGRAALAAPTLKQVRKVAPALPSSDIVLVRANAAAQLAGGTMMIANKAPRVAALVLAGSLVPTTVSGHPWWTITDKTQRKQQKVHFEKNLAIFGGLLFVLASRRKAQRLPLSSD